MADAKETSVNPSSNTVAFEAVLSEGSTSQSQSNPISTATEAPNVAKPLSRKGNRVLNNVVEFISKRTDSNLIQLVKSCDEYFGFEPISVINGAKNKSTGSENRSHGKPQSPAINSSLTLHTNQNQLNLDLISVFKLPEATIPFLYEVTQTLASPHIADLLKLKVLDQFLKGCDFSDIEHASHVFRALCHEITSISNPKYQSALVYIVKNGLNRLENSIASTSEFKSSLSNQYQKSSLTPLHATFIKLCSNSGYHFLASPYLDLEFIRPDPRFGTNYATIFIFYHHLSILFFEREEYSRALESATTALVACPWMRSESVFARYLLTLLAASNDGSNLELGTSRATMNNPNEINLPSAHIAIEQFTAALKIYNTNHKYSSYYGLSAAPQNIIAKEITNRYSAPKQEESKNTKSKDKPRNNDDPTPPSTSGTHAESDSEPIDEDRSNPAFDFLNEIKQNLPFFVVCGLEDEVRTFVSKHRELYFRNLPEYYLSVGSKTVTETDKCCDYLNDVFEVDPNKFAAAADIISHKNKIAMHVVTGKVDTKVVKEGGPSFNGSATPREPGSTASSFDALEGTINSKRGSKDSEDTEAVGKSQLQQSLFDKDTQDQIAKEYMYELVMKHIIKGTIEEESSFSAEDPEDAVMNDVLESDIPNHKNSYWVSFKHNESVDPASGKVMSLEDQLSHLRSKLEAVGAISRLVNEVGSGSGLPNRHNTIIGAAGLAEYDTNQLNIPFNSGKNNNASRLELRLDEEDSFMEENEEFGFGNHGSHNFRSSRHPTHNYFAQEHREAGSGGKSNLTTLAQVAARKVGEVLNEELKEYYFLSSKPEEGNKLAGEEGDYAETKNSVPLRGAKRVRSKSGGYSQDEKSERAIKAVTVSGSSESFGPPRRRNYRQMNGEEGESQEAEAEEVEYDYANSDEDEDLNLVADEYEDNDDTYRGSDHLSNTRMTRARTRAQVLASSGEHTVADSGTDDDRMDISEAETGAGTDAGTDVLEDEEEDDDDMKL